MRFAIKPPQPRKGGKGVYDGEKIIYRYFWLANFKKMKDLREKLNE